MSSKPDCSALCGLWPIDGGSGYAAVPGPNAMITISTGASPATRGPFYL